MKKLFLLMLMMLIQVGVKALNVTVDESWVGPFTLSDHVTVKSPATLTILGDLNDTNNKKIVVEAGATLIVEGNMDLENSQSTLNGDVIVSGDVTLKNTDMLGSANLIVGGTLSAGGGNLNGVTGEVYLLDPEANPSPPTLPNPPLDLEDLLINESTDLVDQVGVIVEDIIADITPEVWDGQNSTDWSTAANWTAVVPSAYTSTTIENVNCPTAVGNVTVGDLTFNLGTTGVFNGNLTVTGDLVINEGCQLTVAGNLTVLGNTTINNSITSVATIIVDGSISGNSTVNWPLTEMGWWYIGHYLNGVSEVDYENSFGVDEFALNTYDGGWSRIAGKGDAYAGEYPFNEPLQGYSLIFRNTGQVLSLNGSLNADESYSLAYNAGWHLVSNPYPAYVDVLHSDFNLSDFNQTIYIRKNNNEVSTYNSLVGDVSSLNGGSRYIAPGQCMWLEAINNGAGVSISKSTRTHTTGGYGLKSASAEPNDNLKLILQSDFGKDEAVIVFNQNGSKFYTPYDSEKVMNGGKIANLYSIKDGRNIAINSFPELKATDVVPLGYNVSDEGISEITLRIANINDFKPEVDVYLEDKLTGYVVNLRDTQEYTFMPESSKSNDRFEIKFEMITTGIETNSLILSDQNVLIYAVKNNVIVKVSDYLLKNKDGIIEVFNLDGKLVSKHELGNSETKVNVPKTNTMYIIKVRINNESYQEKVIALD